MGITLAVNLKHMNAQELRLGNWVYSKILSKNEQVSITTFYEVNELGIQIEGNFDPIELTPEILEKLDFRLKEPSGVFAWKFSAAGDFINVKCEYLHQLQNLYFALTGEELQIEL